MENEVKVKSLYKAIKILECFSEKKPELGITEISQQVGLYKSNVHNIISTFEALGYVESNPDNGKYRLGKKILELAHVISSNISFRRIVLPYMHEIANHTNETVYLGIPNDGDVLYLDSAHPNSILERRAMLGVKAPMYCTAIGKAMLAYYNQKDIIRLVKGKMIKFTDNTITDINELLDNLKVTRERGFAVDNMEHEYGIKCVGMAIRDKDGSVIAGISVSGPSLRFSDENIEQIAALLKEKVSMIQERL